jgi:integrase
MTWDHPGICGEHALSSAFDTSSDKSPPHSREARRALLNHTGDDRITRAATRRAIQGRFENRHEQVAALAAATGLYGLTVQVLAYTGLRFGELAALRTDRVDLMRRRLEIAESVTEVNGKAVFGTPKNHQRRSVPVPGFLSEDLAATLAGKAPGELAFPSPDGGVLRVGNFRRRYFDAAAKQVGLDGLTPHELTHTAASLAIATGASVKAVQRMLGHASAAMTLDVYSGLFEDDLDTVAEHLDAAARGARVPVPCPEATVVSLTQRQTAS